MDIQHYRRIDRPFQYIAARLGGPFDSLPSWFPLLEKTCKLRYDDERNVHVRTITGAWRMVEPGDWVVLQRGGNVWHVEHEDFIKLWEKV